MGAFSLLGDVLELRQTVGPHLRRVRWLRDRHAPSSTECLRRYQATGPPPRPDGPSSSPGRAPHDGTRTGTSLDGPHGAPSSRVSPRIRCPRERGNSTSDDAGAPPRGINNPTAIHT